MPSRVPPRHSSSARTPSASQFSGFRKTLLGSVRSAGEILVGYHGKTTNPRQKESASSIVCDADLAAEASVIKQIRARFPDHNIISEESGRTWNNSEYTWVIDPLDGTSNFVAGLPWFGVMIGLLQGKRPILAAMSLPIDRVLYTAELGAGAFRDGKKIRVTSETNPQHVLCAFGFDPTPSPKSARTAALLVRVAGTVRNTRATNSLVDFCYTVDGRLGACINLKAKIWDIVSLALILPEAGGVLTALDGKPIRFDLTDAGLQRDYTVLGANPSLHRQLRKIVARTGGL